MEMKSDMSCRKILIFTVVFLLSNHIDCQQQQQWYDYNSYTYYTTVAPPAFVPNYQQVPAPATQNQVSVEMTSAPAVVTPASDNTSATTTTDEKTQPPFIPKLVTYWGQNAAEKVLGTTESSLEGLCTNRSPYSSIIIGYVNKFSDKQNIDKLPGMSFTIHCRKSYSDKYHSLLYCPEIANDIRFCHDKGIKILIGIGGPNSASYFESDVKARKLAEDIWNLFLGGDEMPDLRPFGSVVLDGINMFMEPHSHDLHHDHTFLMTLHNLRRDDLARNYLITLSPSCLFPDPYFGPGRDKILQESISLIDQIYVRFTNPRCCVKDSLGFERSLNNWRNFISLLQLKGLNAPELFIGAPAKPNSVVNGACYRTPKELLPIINNLKKVSKFRGVIVIDNAFDIKNGGVGFTFSKELLKIILPKHLHEIPRYKPILTSNDTLSEGAGVGPVHDDISLENDDDISDEDDIESKYPDYLIHTADGKKISVKPTAPIVVVSNKNESQDEDEVGSNSVGHENTTVTHSDDDLMEIDAKTQNDDHTNHDQGTTNEHSEEKVFTNATTYPDHEAATQTQQSRIKYQDNINKGAGEDADVSESNDDENTDSVEEIVEEETEQPKNDPVLNDEATMGETPDGLDVNHPLNNATVKTDSNYETEITPLHAKHKDKTHKIKTNKLRDPNDDFIIPFFDRAYPTLVPTAISNRKNWKDMKMKKMGKQKFHGHVKNIQPFFDRNLPTLKPTAKSGKNWKNQKNFHHQPQNNQTIAETDLWSSIFPKNGSVEHLISKHISDKINRKPKKKRKQMKKMKSFCERCQKRTSGDCQCKHLTFDDCKTCKKHLSKKCQNVCKVIENLLQNIDKELNSTLEREYLSNKFKNYSKIMLERKMNEEEKIIVKKHKHEKTKLVNVFSKLRDIIRNDIHQTKNLTKMKLKEIASKNQTSIKNEKFKSLKFAHNFVAPHIVTPLHTVKLHPLKLENGVNKLKFDHIANGIQTAVQVQKLGESHQQPANKLNGLRFEKHSQNIFPLNKEKHKTLLQKLHLADTNKSSQASNKIRFSNKTKEILQQAVKLLQLKTHHQKPKIISEDTDDFSGSDNNQTETNTQEIGSGDLKTKEEKNQSVNFNVIPKMYDDLKNFIVEDIANGEDNNVDQNNLDEDFQYFYDDDDDLYTPLYDDDGSTSGLPYEEDIVYFYPDGTQKNYASQRKYDSKTYWKEDFEHRVPNVADTMTGERSPQYELKVPNVFNPFGNSELPLKHGAQMEENSKYLQLLQDDIQKQIDTFNEEIIDEQPVSPDQVEPSNSTKPHRLPEEELEKLTTNSDDVFEKNDAVNEVVQEGSKKRISVPQITHIDDTILKDIKDDSSENSKIADAISLSKNIIPKSELKKLIEFSNENKDAFLQFKDLGRPTENVVSKDLISNVNVKGNMDQLKYLMAEMQKTIDNANNAIEEKQMEDLNEVDAEDAKSKNSDQNSSNNNEK